MPNPRSGLGSTLAGMAKRWIVAVGLIGLLMAACTNTAQAPLRTSHGNEVTCGDVQMYLSVVSASPVTATAASGVAAEQREFVRSLAIDGPHAKSAALANEAKAIVMEVRPVPPNEMTSIQLSAIQSTCQALGFPILHYS